jgi:hypothetical protein
MPRSIHSTLIAFLAAAAWLSIAAVPARAQQLSVEQLLNLLGADTDGTTAIINGGADRVFVSVAHTNELRRSPALGLDFMRKFIRPDAVREGVFFAVYQRDGKPQFVKGVAAVVADKDTGGAVVALLESFQDDKSPEAFTRKPDRLYSAMSVTEKDGVLECVQRKWVKLSQVSAKEEFVSGPCDFLVGNHVPGATNG